VVGQVLQPGVVELPAGSRVVDAVAAAGGATSDADLGAINLARVLVDGEQVVVPLPGQVLAAAGPATASTTVPGGPGIDLNTADVAALDTLPGVGPVLAQRIVDWRDAHGRFSDVEELREVSGIGPSLLERVRDQVHV
jgi:competence protein ComEA